MITQRGIHVNKDILPLFPCKSCQPSVAKAMSGWLLSAVCVGLLPAHSAAAAEQMAVSAVDDRAGWVQFPPPKPKPVQADRESVAPAAPEQKATPAVPASNAAAPSTPAPPSTPAAEAPARGINIIGFKFSGNHAISSDDLSKALAPLLGLKSEMADFDQIAEAVTRVYKERGLLARGELPKQELSNGWLRINVTEAKFAGTVVNDPQGLLPASNLIVKIIDTQQARGQTVKLGAIDAASAQLAELPGIQSQISLQAGEAAGETVALVQLSKGKQTEVQVSLDNNGARSVGAFRQIVWLNFNNPRKVADKFSVNILNSEGAQFGRLNYVVPVGVTGWRLGGNASFMHYKLVQDFASLNAQGPSASVGLALNGPLWQTGQRKLHFNWALDNKHYRNDAADEMVSRYQSQTSTWGLEYANADPSGAWQYRSGVDWTVGYLDLSASTSSHISRDSETTQTSGYFQRLRLNHFQRVALGQASSFNAQLQAQFANQNLDGSEKFYLGGAQGVRAYPSNEAGGSQALLASLELQHQLPLGDNRLTLAGFYDWGEAMMNKDNNYPNAASLNRYALQGAGLWLGSSINTGHGQADIKLTWARRIGSNPGANTAGLDQDGSLSLDRYWLNMNYAF